MNKNCYRVIFNKARGMLMVVPDIASGQASSSSSRSGRGEARCVSSLSRLGFSLLLALGCVSLSARAGLVADGAAPAGQRPNIISSASGTPQVNIQTPGSGGVSHNKFSQFDVDGRGAILNNSHSATQTQIGGMVNGNPWLARGEARIILNEVNAREPSQLNGVIEVAGRKAQVVIANPVGITCDGCGFINANRSTLTTGQARLHNGQLAGYDVSRGEIVIQGQGMDATRQDSTDIIARAVKVNAAIRAQELNVTTGQNNVDAAHRRAVAKTADGSPRPTVAVDVSHLGGMYANKIRLLGTEKGVGVSNAGTLGTSAGDVVINADGTITNSGALQATENLRLSSQSAIHNTGMLAAGMKSDGTQNASGDLSLESLGELASSGHNLVAGTLSATASSVDFSASQSAAKNIDLTATQGDINTRNANIVAQQQFAARTQGTFNNDGGTLSADKLALTASKLSNQQGVLQQIGEQELMLSHANGIDNRGGTLASNSKKLTLNAAALNNRQGQVMANAIAIDTGRQSVNNQNGLIAATRKITVNGGGLNNDGGLVQAGSDIALKLKDGSLNNSNGNVLTSGTLTVNSGGINNDAGLLQAGSGITLELKDGTLSNRNSGSNGGILSRGALSINSGMLDNENGFIAAAHDVRIISQALNNTAGTLASDALLNLTTAEFNNQSGLLQAGEDLFIDTQGNALTNVGGDIASGKNLSLLSGALLNASGNIVSNADLLLNTHGNLLDNQSGAIIAGGNARLDGSDVNNRSGQIQAAGKAQINSTATLDNTQGLVRSGKTLTVNTNSIINRDTAHENAGLEGQSVSLNAAALDNVDGAVRSNKKMVISGIATLDNTRGLLSAGGELNVKGGRRLALTNTEGTLIAGTELTVNAASVTGDGSLLSQDEMTLNVQKAFVNTGSVIANGNIDFTLAKGLINEGLIKAGNALTLAAADLTNRKTGEISAAENHLLIAGDVTNRGLLDGGLTHLVATTLNNYGTGRIYGDHIALQADTINNEAKGGTAPVIAAREQLDIGVGTLNNVGHGLIYSAGDVAIGGSLNDQWQAQGRALAFNNHSSTLESAGDMTLNIGQINNINDRLITEVAVVESSAHHEAALKGSTARFDWDDIDTSSKDKYGVHRAKMPDGTGGKEFYEYNYRRTITETQVKESDPGQIIAGGDLTINSDQVNNKDSRIVAGGLLGGLIGELNNIATMGERVITDTGTQTRWYAKKKKKKMGGTKTSQGKETSSYRPAAVVQTIDLQQMAWQSLAPVSDSGTTVAGRDASALTTRTVDAGRMDAELAHRPLSPAWGERVEISVGPDSAIRLTPPDVRLPDSSLYQLRPAADLPFLVETDPRFTNKKQWLGSDYMMRAFVSDPDNAQKRLGDGFYEQRLIREQITALTGSRYLQGYDNDEQQFRALMDAGVAFGKEYGLVPGVALSPAQMALLTGDMVWLVQQDVTLPDGSVQRVLVPQVYARVQPGDLDGSGALLAGGNVALDVTRDLTSSGHISGRDVVQLSAENLLNGGFIGGGRVSLEARCDIVNAGGTLQGGNGLVAVAGRDISSFTTTRGDSANRWIDRPAGIYVQNDDGTLGLQALNNISLTATQVSNAGAGGRTQILAGNDLHLGTVTTAHSEYGSWSKGNDRSLFQQTDVGSQINGSGSVTLAAGHDISARAASISARSELTLAAGNDVSLTGGESSYHLTENSRQSTGGMLSKKTMTGHDEVQATRTLGSSLDGNSITVQAGHNLLVQGSSVAASGDVSLFAGHDLTVTAAAESRTESHWYREKKTGFSGTGGVGFSYGRNALKTTDDGTTLSSAGSTVGSTGGSVSLTAGNGLTVRGSEVLAGKNLALTGREVNILAAENQSKQTHTMEQKTSGLTLALSGAAGSAVNQAVTQANAAADESAGRLAALRGVQASLSGVQAYQASELGQAEGKSTESLFGLNLSYGSRSSKSTTTQTANQSQGSRLTAGNNLSVSATGGDIRVQGGELQAGKNLALDAARDVILESALNAQKLDGRNESKGGSVGVGINFGGSDSGVTVNASVNRGKGFEKGTGTSHAETTLDAGNNLRIVSGRDVTMTGAQASANGVKMDVGRSLTLVSEQDTDNYDSKQTSGSAGGSVGTGGSASVSYSRDKMHSTYESVIEQTGIFAGKGGFDITVGEHTQLDGAVIASTATVDKNKLDTGTLGFRDIENHAEYKVEHQSAGMSTGGSIGMQFAGNAASTLMVGMNGSDSAESTTKAAVSEGTIIVRDAEKQSQNIDDLSRDAEHANQTLSPIFDKEKEQRRLQEAQLIGEIGVQVGDIARTRGEIAAAKAQNDPQAIEAAKAALAKAGKTSPTEKELREQIRNTAMEPYGTGSALQQGIQAATAAIQGLAGGDITKAIAGGAAPYLAEVIHDMTADPTRPGGINTEANLMAHAVVGAVLAEMQGNSGLAGAAGAVTGEYLARQLYPDTPRDRLSEEQKQTLSALSTLAAGLAGGLAGDSTADAIAGGQAGKNAAENNSLSGDKARAAVKESAEHWKDQVRNALGEGTTSSIANGIINAIADTGDSAIGSADYVADAAMALASCAAGDSYCTKAMSDLAGKNQAVADSVKALMQSETWLAMVGTIKQASDGNQMALEATGSMLAGIILPGKKVPHVPNAGAVGNMSEFLKKSGFGNDIKDVTQKTSKQYQGQSIYQAQGKTGDTIKKGDQLYLDAKHKDHLEIFDKNGNFKAVLNLDGSVNFEKTKAGQGRKIKID
jgi:filamentous hemagglutinin